MEHGVSKSLKGEDSTAVVEGQRVRKTASKPAQPVPPRTVNMLGIHKFFDHAGEVPAVPPGKPMLDTRFKSAVGVDILPLIRLLDQAKDLDIQVLDEPPVGRSKAAPQPYFRGVAELLQTYATWKEIDVALGLQAIRLLAPEGGKIKHKIEIVVPPFNNSVVKKSAKGPKWTVVDKRAKYITALLFRSGIADFDPVKVEGELGNDFVTWSVGSVEARKDQKGIRALLMTIEPEKNNARVFLKPKTVQYEVKSSDVGKDGWEFELPGTKET
jgi:hypothetical protein